MVWGCALYLEHGEQRSATGRIAFKLTQIIFTEPILLQNDIFKYGLAATQSLKRVKSMLIRCAIRPVRAMSSTATWSLTIHLHSSSYSSSGSSKCCTTKSSNFLIGLERFMSQTEIAMNSKSSPFGAKRGQISGLTRGSSENTLSTLSLLTFTIESRRRKPPWQLLMSNLNNADWARVKIFPR